MAKMLAFQVSRATAPLELVERPIPEPGSGQRGDFFACASGQVTGATSDGGYAEYMLAPVSALAHIPAELTAVEAAPLMCAGLTTYNGLRRSGARAGNLVAVVGIGGFGHLALQFAAKMGFRTVAIARGQDKGPLAMQLGAHHYIDSDAEDMASTRCFPSSRRQRPSSGC